MNYKADQLPGGRYWEPTGEIREIMASLKPHNDNSESVLGMNDWLTTTFPSMHQQTRSTLIEMSTNKTIEWLAKQPSDRRNLVTDFATSKRKVTKAATSSPTNTGRGVFETKRSSSRQGQGQRR